MGGHISIIQSDNIIDIVLSDIPNYYYTFYDTVLDDVSYSMCLSKPTYQLVFDRLEIPKTDQGVIEDLLHFAWDVAGLIVKPMKYVNDKKFCTHTYETSRIFRTPNGGMAANSEISNCDKILIYLANHANNIEEPREKRITRDVTVGDNDYTIPSELWYTFNIDDDNSIYFYIHISVTQAYTGLLLAVNRERSTRLNTFKDLALDHYNRTMGQNAFGGAVIGDL